MHTFLAGIDEAGYGPLLGPLCVGLSVFHVHEPDAGDGAPTPDLWKVLQRAVCREPGRSGARDRHGRIAIADSKQLKLANSVSTSHPLVHLERGVLSCLGAMGHAIESDVCLFETSGVRIPEHHSYAGEVIPLPVGGSAGELSICVNMLKGACESANAAPVLLRCRCIDESEFNGVIARTNNKGETTVSAIGEHLRTLWNNYAPQEHAGTPARLGIVCDRLGGRASYAAMLARELSGVDVEIVEESPTRSRYILRSEGRRAGIAFLTEGETAHLPVALASMMAKYTRELLMVRLNRHFAGVYKHHHGIELKPTAGYALDARRWLTDVGELLVPADRARLVRRA